MKKVILLVLGLAVIGAGVGYYMWNKPHKNLTNTKADVTLDAAALFNEFKADETAANAKYLDKVIAVSGKVKEVVNDEGTVKVSLDTGDPNDFVVRCELSTTTAHARTSFNQGEAVTFKGACSGFNFDVLLNNCVEVK